MEEVCLDKSQFVSTRNAELLCVDECMCYMMCLVIILFRNQEEESLRAAIALSQVDTEKQEEEEDQEEEQPQGDLLLDLNTSGIILPSFNFHSKPLSCDNSISSEICKLQLYYLLASVSPVRFLSPLPSYSW